MEIKVSRIVKGCSKTFFVKDGFVPSDLFQYIHDIMDEEQNDQFTYLQIVVKREAVQKEFDGFQEYLIKK